MKAENLDSEANEPKVVSTAVAVSLREQQLMGFVFQRPPEGLTMEQAVDNLVRALSAALADPISMTLEDSSVVFRVLGGNLRRLPKEKQNQLKDQILGLLADPRDEVVPGYVLVQAIHAAKKFGWVTQRSLFNDLVVLPNGASRFVLVMNLALFEEEDLMDMSGPSQPAGAELSSGKEVEVVEKPLSNEELETLSNLMVEYLLAPTEESLVLSSEFEIAKAVKGARVAGFIDNETASQIEIAFRGVKAAADDDHRVSVSMTGNQLFTDEFVSALRGFGELTGLQGTDPRGLSQG